MIILRAVAAELWKMFLADARLSLAVLALVALAALSAGFSPFVAGILLAAGMPAILIVVVLRTAGRQRGQASAGPERK